MPLPISAISQTGSHLVLAGFPNAVNTCALPRMQYITAVAISFLSLASMDLRLPARRNGCALSLFLMTQQTSMPSCCEFANCAILKVKPAQKERRAKASLRGLRSGFSGLLRNPRGLVVKGLEGSVLRIQRRL